MHATFLVTFHKKHAQTSKQARAYAYRTLADMPWFLTPDSSVGAADWFVIGGRDSGLLTLARKPNVELDMRDPYRDLGYADDAQLLDDGLYDSLLAEYAGRRISTDAYGAPVFLDWMARP